MRVAIAADHAGYALKDQLRAVIEEQGLTVLDLGTNGPDRVDYPDFGHAVAQAIRDGRASHHAPPGVFVLAASCSRRTV